MREVDSGTRLAKSAASAILSLTNRPFYAAHENFV